MMERTTHDAGDGLRRAKRLPIFAEPLDERAGGAEKDVEGPIAIEVDDVEPARVAVERERQGRGELAAAQSLVETHERLSGRRVEVTGGHQVQMTVAIDVSRSHAPGLTQGIDEVQCVESTATHVLDPAQSDARVRRDHVKVAITVHVRELGVRAGAIRGGEKLRGRLVLRETDGGESER